MKSIGIPTTANELRALANEFDAAYWFFSQSGDAEERSRAYDRIGECERAFDASPMTFDEDGNFVSKKGLEATLTQ